MKKLRIVMCISFFALLMIPVSTFNWEENVVSAIDNRVLTNNPFGDNYKADGDIDLTEGIENYIEDRIGYRDEMIFGYTLLHDKAFKQLVHPTYMYGKDGYIFFQAGENVAYGDFHTAFVEMVKNVRDFCEARDIPFLFVFEPAKTSLLSDKLADGINYNNDWVQKFEGSLEEQGIHYVNNSDLLQEKLEQGEAVFNKKYNAGHWNDLGAFYGVNYILETMKEDFPGIHINEMEEFKVVDILQTSLPVSQFPIEEYEPYFVDPEGLTDKTELYDSELKRDANYDFFLYTINEERKAEGSPKALVFQGSYMNGMGYKFMENSFGEYIAVHDYQNIMNLDYYYNIFKPDCVVFEVAEYVFYNEYFSYHEMVNMDLNPEISTFDLLPVKKQAWTNIDPKVEEGEQLTKVKIMNVLTDQSYAYLRIGNETYDFQKESDGETEWFEVTLEKENYTKNKTSIEIVDVENQYITSYEQ